jgi:hypothetical protein
MASLIKKQKNLEQVQISWGTAVGDSRNSMHLDFQPLFRKLRALDLYITGSQQLHFLIEELIKSKSNLERLVLGMTEGVASDAQDKILQQAIKRPPSSPSLKELTLRGIKFDEYTRALWKPIMNLAMLQRCKCSVPTSCET